MANAYYQPGEERAARVNNLFARIAPRYDLINDLQSLWLHRLWKQRLIRMANPRPGQPALDLCCGTGDVALALARHGAEVTGLDFSEPMLAIARERSSKFKSLTATFLHGDAQAIPFPNESFDIITISYGLRNLTDWERGLEEIFRVARTGGRLLILDFGKPGNALWRAVYFGYLRAIVPLFGRVFYGDAQTYAYILESLRHYPAQEGVDAKLRALGCREARIVNLLGGVMSINFAVKP
jgi:demethylmenaquinone methyltransferase/2-methoxy-6-polyprenyl-1,4-benzoquinol methylase